ncbi:ankyrin repeat domain-containing protein [Wolbachia endosymbiont (group A) of Gymnosoma rotundatum]|uniref:ankyrin repeat domain-containing protein n=1 Tax=Wolbachia endosymbiont (group A) of Gymnosoma rotundatum TaxID=2954016 RepID=UPI002227107B|nr:ankyrin repeat domain-containing protein [Wolbachia endosymbiont (group A) of Gymnosoma rotundatum]
MLTDNHRYLGHLERVGKVSGMVMHGMIAKNVVGDLLRGDYEDVAINLGFLFGSQGLAKVAEVASMKGAGYMLEGRALLGKSLRFASPFLSRGISAFIAYDLYNQVKEYEKGNKDALVPIIGDSLQLGVDSIELGIEIGEGLGLELLEGVSAVTGPIGMAIGAVVFVGTDVYMAVRTVEKIDEQIHLTGWEKVTEGTRALLGLLSSGDIEDSLEEKKANNQAVKNAISFLKGNPYIQRYVFPNIKVNIGELCFPFEPGPYSPDYCMPNRGDRNISRILDNVVLLDQKRNDIKWSRTRPDNLEGIDLFCLPKGDWESVPKSGTYYCDGAIGVEYENNRAGNYTLISLGDGKDRIKGFQDSSNIFVLGDGHKEITGGDKDDNFIFGGKSVSAAVDREIKGSIDGRGGIDTIDVGGLIPHDEESKVVGRYQVSADFRQGILKDTSKVALNISNVNQFLGRKGRVDRVVSACGTKYMDSKGGENKNYLDSITIPKDDACFYDTQIIVNPYTKVTNSAINGNFTYFIRGDKGKEAYIDLGPNSQSNNMFAFNYTLKDIAAIDKSEKNITFSFVEEFYKREKKLDVNSSFNLTVSGANENITTYHLVDNTKVVMGQNNVYAMQNTEKPIDSLVKDYSSIAGKSRMYVIVRLNDEALTVGHSHHDILMNDPKARASHLVGSGGENVFVITSGHEKLTLEKLPISDVIIYDFDQENKIDTLSLREIKEQLKKDIGREINTEVNKIDSDLLINLSLDDASKKEVVKIRLKGALENNWYKRVNIVIDNVFVIEEILDDFELTPQPLVFDNNSQTIYVINPKDVVKGDKIRVKKEIGDYTFARDNDALVITNSLSSNVDKNNLSTIILNDFYYENNQDKMETLKIEFNDKKILLRKEIERIDSAGNFSELKKKVRIDSYKAVMRTIKEQKLFEAIERNNIGEVKELINHGVSIDARNNEEQTPLHYAAKGSAENSNLEVVRYLVEEKSADINAKDNFGRTPLHCAAEGCNLEVVKYLIEEKHVDVNVKSNGGQVLLHSAAEAGRLRIVKYLIEKGANLNVKDNVGQTPLHYAAMNDALKVVKYFIGKGAKIDLEVNSETPLKMLKRRGHGGLADSIIKELTERLFDAVEYDDFGEVQSLINQGVSVNVKDSEEQTLLHCAVSNGKLKVVKYLIEKKGVDFNVKEGDFGWTLLHLAAFGGNLEVVKYFIERKQVDFNVGDSYKITPLHYAVEHSRLEVVKYLIEKKKADINVKDGSGKVPLHYAAVSNDIEVVKYLLGKKNANINATDNDEQTPLHFAAKSGNLEVVRYLIEEKEANFKLVDKSGQAPLHFAAEGGSLEVVKYLIEEKSANVNIGDNYGYTPLHLAASNGKLEIVKYLIDKKAHINARNNDGKIPLDLATQTGVVEFLKQVQLDLDKKLLIAAKGDALSKVEDLVTQGANIRARDENGQIPLCIAVQHNRLDIINFLLGKGTNIEASDFRDNTVLKLAYCIKGVMEKMNSEGQTSDFEGLKSKLPESVKNLVFSSEVCIKNVEHKRYLYSPNKSDNFQFDKERRYVFTWPSNDGDNDAKWKVEPNGDNVYLKNVEHKRYLYSPNKSDNFQFDKERRYVFTWPSNDGDNDAKWKVEPNGDNVYLKNVEHKRYLYSPNNGFQFDSERWYVFTWPSNEEGNDAFKWKVEDCEVARRSRRHHIRHEHHHRGHRNNSIHFESIGARNRRSVAKVVEASLQNDKIGYNKGKATSGGIKPSSWINDLVGWVKNSIGKLSSKPEETSSTASSMSQVDMQIDADGTIMLLDVLIRKVTGQKYTSSADQDVSLIKAQGYALNIIEKFEKVLNEAAIKSGISAINLDFNPVKSQLAIVGQIRNGKFSEISKTLYSFAKEACPELEQTGKFLTCLKSNLEGEKEAVLLQQKVEQTSDQEISRKVVAKGLPKKPDTFLNGTSVVKGIDNILGL